MKKAILILSGLMALAVSGAESGQQQLATAIKDAHVETIQTAEQLKSTMAALNDLSKQKQGDLRPAYNTYVSQVGNTKAAAAATQKRIQWMDGEGKTYFQEWQTTVTSISNASLRKNAQKRLDSARDSYGKVEASLKKAADQFKPFLSDLEDIQKALSTDVTPEGVKSIRSVARTANSHHEDVAEAIDAARKEMGKMYDKLSSQAK